LAGAVAGRLPRVGLDGLSAVPDVPVVGGEQDGAAGSRGGVEQGAELADLFDRPGGFVAFPTAREGVVDGVALDTDGGLALGEVLLDLGGQAGPGPRLQGALVIQRRCAAAEGRLGPQGGEPGAFGVLFSDGEGSGEQRGPGAVGGG